MFTKHVTGVVLALGIAGCTNTQPKYVEPKGEASSEVSILKGGWGTYIHEVDGMHVNSSNLPMDNVGGNSVTATPGNHLFMVWVHVGSPGLIAPPGPLMVINMAEASRDDRHTFYFKCEKGHTYEFSRRNMFTSALKVTDQNTGRSLDIK